MAGAGFLHLFDEGDLAIEPSVTSATTFASSRPAPSSPPTSAAMITAEPKVTSSRSHEPSTLQSSFAQASASTEGWIEVKGLGRGSARPQNGQQPHTSTMEVIPEHEFIGEPELNAHLHERIRQRKLVDTSHPRPDSRSDGSAAMVRKFHSKAVSNYVNDLAALGTCDPTSWLACPEIPTAREVLDQNEPWMKTKWNEATGAEDVQMEGNVLEGAWKDPGHYLETHYAMLREDAVYPLREATTWFKAHPEEPENAYTSSSLGIYSKVHVTTLTPCRRGLGVRVVFSLNRVGFKVRWEQSNRLMTGSLVVLSPTRDAFRTKCIVAVVAARPLDLVRSNPPMIDLFLARPEEDLDVDPSIEYTMLEDRTSFFEATRHVGLALQKLATEKFPFRKQIVQADPKVGAPQYLRDQPVLNLSGVFQDCKGAGIDILTSWPSKPETTLDKSQQDALHTIFKRKVAIIQGPPGTGKTHVSVTALKILLDNMGADDPPIVVACQTNHALDQLLRHVAQHDPECFVRLGGRSKDQGVVKNRTLFNIRPVQQIRIPGGMRNAARQSIENMKAKFCDILQPLELGKDSVGFLNLDTFKRLEILTPRQVESLQKGDTQWKRSANTSKGPIEEWLGNQLLPFTPRCYEPDNLAFEFEELDLEYEQVKEMEAENVCEDDDKDFESLPGDGISVWAPHSGKTSNVSEEQIERWLHNNDMWQIPLRHRGAVFNYLRRRAIMSINTKIRASMTRFNEQALRYRYGGFESDAIVLRQQKIIGVTTTGLSKYRALISAVCPRILMVEEAAEVMESPVTAGCVPSLQHLILVGDHKQLRPQCSVKALEEAPWHLNVSLFERLVNNKLPYKMLKRQRRMIPEVRRLLTPIYGKEINDHPTMKDVAVRPPVPGMGGMNSFFFTHSYPDAVDDTFSSTNPTEAAMVVGFYDYLISNGLNEEQITILTFYNGQRKLLLKLLREHQRLRAAGTANRIFKVLTVDSYQGEENDVVLLSLVRSNDSGKLGFISVENRICVALSRARRGFYMFGNAELLVGESKLWAKVVNVLLSDPSVSEDDQLPTSRLVFRIPLHCQNHNKKMFIESMHDWEEIDGGCYQACRQTLPCGHMCQLKCHPFDHNKVTCLQPCTRQLACGHMCSKQCCDDCHCQTCGRRPGLIGEAGESSTPDAGTRRQLTQAWHTWSEGEWRDKVQPRGSQPRGDPVLQDRWLTDQANSANTAVVQQAAAIIKPLPPSEDKTEVARPLLLNKNENAPVTAIHPGSFAPDAVAPHASSLIQLDAEPSQPTLAALASMQNVSGGPSGALLNASFGSQTPTVTSPPHFTSGVMHPLTPSPSRHRQVSAFSTQMATHVEAPRPKVSRRFKQRQGVPMVALQQADVGNNGIAEAVSRQPFANAAAHNQTPVGSVAPQPRSGGQQVQVQVPEEEELLIDLS